MLVVKPEQVSTCPKKANWPLTVDSAKTGSEKSPASSNPLFYNGIFLLTFHPIHAIIVLTIEDFMENNMLIFGYVLMGLVTCGIFYMAGVVVERTAWNKLIENGTFPKPKRVVN